MSETLKITSFEIENVKKVRAVSYRPAQDGLTVDAFCEKLTGFVNTLETWHGLLEDFRPAAATAKESASSLPDEKELAMGGFMQV